MSAMSAPCDFDTRHDHAILVSMRNISLNLPEELLEASRRYSGVLRLTRAEYIRQAIERMNRQIDAELRAKKMREASSKCRKADLEVNAEFAAIEHDIKD